MKRLSIALVVLIALFSIQSGANGVNSSGGTGVGGHFTLSTGYSPGAMDISIFTSESSGLSVVKKYFELAGAQPSVGPAGAVYQIEPGSAFIVNSMASAPNGTEFYQLNLTLKFDELYDIGAGNGLVTIAFRGGLADMLYSTMESSGATRIGQTTHGSILQDEALICQKSAAGGLRGGVWCSLQVKN